MKSHLYFDKESDYSEENICENVLHYSTPQKENKHIPTSAADVLHAVLEQEIPIAANAKGSHWRCSDKKGVLKIVNISQENNCARFSFFNNVAGLSLLIKRLWYRCFPVKSDISCKTLKKQSERNRFSLLQRDGCNAYCFN